MKSLLLLPVLLLPLLSTSQTVDLKLPERQVASGKGLMIFGAIMCAAPVLAIKDAERAQMGLYTVGLGSVAAGVLFHTIGKHRDKKRIALTFQ